MSHEHNPFLPPPQEQVGSEFTDVTDDLDTIEFSGPAAPLYAPREHRAQFQYDELPPAGIIITGLHGGAGATTLAALLGPDAYDAGRALPAADEWASSPHRTQVLVVARTHHRGLEAAAAFTTAWAHGELADHIDLLGLVLIADGPGKKAAAERIKTISRAAPRGWVIPWVEEWRMNPGATPPLRARFAVTAIGKAARNATASHNQQ